jgi:hypothetical protein
VGSLPARGAAVTPPLTLEQALVRLAPEVNPELAQKLAQALAHDRPWVLGPWVLGPVMGHILDWSPLAVRLDESKQKLLAELLRRLQEDPRRLILLPDDAALPPVPLHEGQLAALELECFDVANSAIILGERRYRARVVPRVDRTAAPPDPGDNPSDEAMSADDAAAAATPSANPAPAVLTEAEAKTTPTPAVFVARYLGGRGDVKRPVQQHSQRGLLRARDDAGLHGVKGFGDKELLNLPAAKEYFAKNKNPGGHGSRG